MLITSGCQQAIDLLQRTLIAHGETVLLEDPVYSGIKNVFQRGGARLEPVHVNNDGADLERLEQAIAGARADRRPRMLVLTPNFQNPTGATMPLRAREEALRLAAHGGVVVVENDTYGDLRYEGAPLPAMKALDASGDTVLLRSFSKLAFPGLRVGWVTGPRRLIERLTENKQWCDLHTDQLSQAVLLRFAESGRLAAHRERVLAGGRERLRAAIDGCRRWLPTGSTWTEPAGGMNLWVRLPEPLDASELLPEAERQGVSYSAGRHFAIGDADPGSLRISFAGLEAAKITAGMEILGRVCSAALERARQSPRLDSFAIV